MPRLVAVMSFLTVSSGCAHFGEAFQTVDSSVLTSSYAGQPTPLEEVGVLIGDDVSSADCERVALLRAVASASVVDKLRAEAGRLGANTVDLRSFRATPALRSPDTIEFWDAVALHCPT